MDFWWWLLDCWLFFNLVCTFLLIFIFALFLLFLLFSFGRRTFNLNKWLLLFNVRLSFWRLGNFLNLWHLFNLINFFRLYNFLLFNFFIGILCNNISFSRVDASNKLINCFFLVLHQKLHLFCDAQVFWNLYKATCTLFARIGEELARTTSIFCRPFCKISVTLNLRFLFEALKPTLGIITSIRSRCKLAWLLLQRGPSVTTACDWSHRVFRK